MISSQPHAVKPYFSVSILWLLLVGFMGLNTPVLAYHFFYIQSGGNQLVLRWRTLPVNFVVDSDPTTFQAEVQTAIDTWNNVTTAQNVLGKLTQSSMDFTGANYLKAWGSLTGDGQQELVYDADGSALQALGLNPGTINGYAPKRMEVVGGQGAITDAFFIVNGSRADFDRLSTTVHELGHIQGLAHSSVGMHNSGSPPSDALDPVNVNSVPTMHPFSVGGTARRTLEADDRAALSELYPEASFGTTFGGIEGTITRCFSTDSVTGANVRAISTSNPNVQVSRFTGYDGNSQGRFVISGLPPGSYRLVVEPMGANDFNIAMRFGTPPFRQDQDFQTEYYNPPEEDECSEETPDSPVPVSVSAGATIVDRNFKVGGVDLAFVVDDTGSMSNEIGAVRTVLAGFINTMDFLNQTLGIPFPSVAIVTFKDDVTKRLVSKDPVRLLAVINGLTASAGGDCPESSNAALLTAGRLLRRGGVATLFTDADSRADGPNRNAVTTLYRSRGARVFTLLSGTCSGTLSSPVMPDHTATGMNSAASQNLDEFPLPPVLGPENSVRTFSEISIESGGFFIAIPGIKSGDPVERQRYINTGTNLAVSSAVPALGLVTPGDGPQGATLQIEVAGSNTNFQSGSTLSFSGTGITVNSSAVVSPVRMIASISVSATATIGFRDVTVTTNLGAGSTETATGTGAFRVANPAVGAAIIGVSPAQGSQGQTLDVRISGANTHFTDGVSVANFGSGVTVNSTRVLNTVSAIANLTIDNAATIGFRDVRVVTGVEVASENTVGPFLVTAPPPALPRVVSISPQQGSRGQTLDVVVTGENTHFANGISVLSFSGIGITVNSTMVGSPTSVMGHISIAPDAPLGFRDIFITTGDEIAVFLGGFQLTGEVFDICLQDESSGNILVFNSTTGHYQFTRCGPGGFALTGVGTLTIRGSIITLQQNGPDRRVLARIDNGVHVGTASVQVFSLGTTFTLVDKNTTNNTCGCP